MQFVGFEKSFYQPGYSHGWQGQKVWPAAPVHWRIEPKERSGKNKTNAWFIIIQ